MTDANRILTGIVITLCATAGAFYYTAVRGLNRIGGGLFSTHKVKPQYHSNIFTIDTPQGKITGKWMNTINGRKIQGVMGIPYARPPVGELRFKNPEPYGNWSSDKDGTKEPSRCPQYDLNNESEPSVVGDEDCLYLNVFTPNASAETKYPVLFFIHGGGWSSGFSSPYGPDMLLDKNVVLVTINYRLGVLGFASTGDDLCPGNFGLKDQVMALEWTRDNISAFGGDSNNVTIIGQSAGGASVHFHMLSPKSRSLFHKAIPMSGTANCPWAITAPKESLERLWDLGKRLNCSGTKTEALITCLMNTEPSELILTQIEMTKRWEGMDPKIIFTPVLESESDFAFITKSDYLSKSSVPMMTGVTTDEGAMNVAPYYIVPGGISSVLSRLNKDYQNIIPASMYFADKSYNPKFVASIIKYKYFQIKSFDENGVRQLSEMFTDICFHECQKIAILRHNGPTFLYLMAYDGEYNLANVVSQGKFKLGATHGDDLQYIFPDQLYQLRQNGFNEEDKKTSVQLVNYITNFATYGNPTPEGGPIIWEPKTASNEYLLINGKNTISAKGYLSKKMDIYSILTKFISK